MKALTRYNLILAGGLSILMFASYSTKTTPVDSMKVEQIPEEGITQNVKPVDLDKAFSFSGEPLPMENFDVRERLDRELLVNTYWQSNTTLMLKNAARYFPVIEPILAEEGVPDDFKYLAAAESAFRNASSPAGAKGIWQFLKKTGEHYGLEVNGEVDERYHLEKATRAACTYLKEYKERFGNWTLAAAAYNMGGTRMKSELADQGTNSYYDLNLSEETMRYVFRIVALKEILSNPDDYGFEVDESAKYEPLSQVKEITISESIPSLAAFADNHGVSYRILKVYNPWLRSTRLTNSQRRTYTIVVPTS